MAPRGQKTPLPPRFLPRQTFTVPSIRPPAKPRGVPALAPSPPAGALPRTAPPAGALTLPGLAPEPKPSAATAGLRDGAVTYCCDAMCVILLCQGGSGIRRIPMSCAICSGPRPGTRATWAQAWTLRRSGPAAAWAAALSRGSALRHARLHPIGRTLVQLATLCSQPDAAQCARPNDRRSISPCGKQISLTEMHEHCVSPCEMWPAIDRRGQSTPGSVEQQSIKT